MLVLGFDNYLTQTNVHTNTQRIEQRQQNGMENNERIVVINVVTSQLPKWQPTTMPTAHTKMFNLVKLFLICNAFK